jgi:tetratricopeptide (TPR) repeat protein
MPAPPSYSPPWRQRLWEAIKPPPAVGRAPRTPEQARRLRRILVSILSLALLAVAGWLVIRYIVSAPERAEAKFQEGMHLMAPATYQDAIARFDQAIAIAPRHAQALYQRGMAKRTLGRADEALSDFTQAAGADPSLAAAYIARGFIYRERGNIKGALDEFSRAIEIKPAIEGFYERGQTWESLGEHQKAIADYDEAIAIMRDAPYVYRARALVKREIGDQAGSEADRAMALQFEHSRQ